MFQASGFAEIPFGVRHGNVAEVRAGKFTVGPVELETLAQNLALEVLQVFRILSHLSRREFAFKAERSERASRLTDVPLGGMHTESAVRHCRYAEIFARRQDVFDPHRQEGAQRDLLAPVLAVIGNGQADLPARSWFVNVDAISAQ